MDKFPDDINRKMCIQIFSTKQLELLRETRKKFTETITSSLNEVVTDIVLEFNEHLERKHRKTIIKELLERYVNIWLIKKDSTHIEILINDEKQIINDVTHIKIVL